MKVEELEKELKQNQLRSIYVLYGEERFLLETVLKNITKIFGEKTLGINYIILDDSNIEQIISDIQTPAFGYERKLIVVKNSGLFKKDLKRKGKNSNNELKEKLNKYIKENIQEINESVILVFVEDNVEKCELISTIENVGVVCEFEILKVPQLQQRLKAIVNAYKVNIDAPTLMYFIECCGTNMQELINEIRKLIEYAGKDGTITKDDIDSLAIKKIDSIIFDLTDSLGKKDTRKAIDVLRGLILSKEPLQKILITLYNHFKKLYLTKFAISENRDIAQSLDLKPNQKFLAGKYKTQASYFKIDELKNILQKFCDLDYKYKVGLIDLELGLESILCAYI